MVVRFRHFTTYILVLNYFASSFLWHSLTSPHLKLYSNSLTIGVKQSRNTLQLSNSYLSRVTTFTEVGDWHNASLLLDSMPSPKCRFAMSSGIICCGKFGQWQRAQELFVQCLPGIDSPLLHSLLGALTRCNRLKDAEVELWLHRDYIDGFSVNLVLQGYRRRNNWKAVLRIFRRARAINCTDINCYVTTILACTERDQFSVAFELLHDLDQNSFQSINSQSIKRKLQSMVFKRWSKHRLRNTKDAQALAMDSDALVDRNATARLLVSLGTAADEGVMPTGFANHGARAGYVLNKIVSRSSRVADFLLEIAKGTDVGREVDYAMEDTALSRLLQLPIVSLGGGPGFDILGAALLTEFRYQLDPNLIQTPVDALVSDYEIGWKSFVDSVVKTFQSSSAANAIHQVNFSVCDITVSLNDPVNRINRNRLTTQQVVLVIASYVVAENAIMLRASKFVFFQDLVQATAIGSVFLFLETTHRLWPEVVSAAYAGIDAKEADADLIVSFPRVSGKRGFGLSIQKIKKLHSVHAIEEKNNGNGTIFTNQLYRRMLNNHRVEVIEMMQTFEAANTDHLKRLTSQEENRLSLTDVSKSKL